MSHKLTALSVTAACGATAFTLAAPAGAAPLQAPTAFVVLQGGTGTDKASAATRAAGGTVTQEWPQIGLVIAEASDDTFDDRVRKMRGIVGAGPTRALQAFSAPTAPAAGVPAGLGPGTAGGDDTAEPLNSQQWDMRMIKADKAHLATDGNRDVTVGVLDSGIEADHPDLAANIDPAQSVSCVDKGRPDTSPSAWGRSTSDHGTHVAGTIAAARNGVGIVGVAPNVRLAAVKVVDDDGYIYPEYAICGFVWAAEKGMEVTNNSYFIDPYYLWCKSNKDERAVITAVERALRYADKKDVVNVASAGNSRWDLSKPIDDTGSPNNLPEGEEPEVRHTDHRCYDMPAELPNVVTVSSVGPTAEKAYYSNFGKNVIDVTAPGGDAWLDWNAPKSNAADAILSTTAGGKWGYKQGTSMAGPHAAGVVALVRGAEPGLSAKQAVRVLTREADTLACPELYDYTDDNVADATCEGGAKGTGFYGAGMVDALEAVTP
jgi:subtilisin family serine protease